MSPFKCPLEDYFRSIAYKKWHPWKTEDVKANAEWKVPEGKIYEVYAYLTINQGVVDLNLRNVADNTYGFGDSWFPQICSITSGDGGLYYYYTIARSPRGWIMSGGEGLRCNTASWVVRYRDITGE